MLSRDEILEVLKREMPYLGREFKVSPVQYGADEIKEELSNE